MVKNVFLRKIFGPEREREREREEITGKWSRLFNEKLCSALLIRYLLSG